MCIRDRSLGSGFGPVWRAHQKAVRDSFVEIQTRVSHEMDMVRLANNKLNAVGWHAVNQFEGGGLGSTREQKDGFIRAINESHSLQSKTRGGRRGAPRKFGASQGETRDGAKRRRGNQSVGSDPGVIPTCFYCWEKGHKRPECFLLQQDKKKAFEKKNGAPQASKP